MRKVDIIEARKSNPSVDFAVRIPSHRWGHPNGTQIVKAAVVDILRSRVYIHIPDDVRAKLPRYERLEAGDLTVQPAAVLAVWDDYVLDQDWTAAIAEDQRRTERIEYDRKRAERAAWIEGFLPAFTGITIPATGSSNVDREGVDLSDELRETFINMGASGSMFGPEHFAPIAARIVAMQQAVLDGQSGWTTGPTDDGIPRVDPADALQATLARLEAVAEGS